MNWIHSHTHTHARIQHIIGLLILVSEFEYCSTGICIQANQKTMPFSWVQDLLQILTCWIVWCCHYLLASTGSYNQRIILKNHLTNVWIFLYNIFPFLVEVSKGIWNSLPRIASWMAANIRISIDMKSPSCQHHTLVLYYSLSPRGFIPPQGNILINVTNGKSYHLFM